MSALAGCASAVPPGDTETDPSVSDSADPVTAQRAHYVDLMLANSYASGPETQSGIMSVISGYGGGYITTASVGSPALANETLTLSVVLGAGSVLNDMQGETYLGLAGIACFTYRLGYYGYTGDYAQVRCPASLTTTAARAVASRQISDQVWAERYDLALKQIPATLAAARQVLFPTESDTAADGVSSADLTASAFAAGTDAQLKLPEAGLALRQTDGGCDYVVFRWIRDSWVGGGTSGFSQAPVARAWAAPTADPCTGAAALAAGQFLTVDRYAGG